MTQETMWFGDAVASAGPYANMCTLLLADNHMVHTNTPSLNFYRPDAQPTVSKHWMK